MTQDELDLFADAVLETIRHFVCPDTLNCNGNITSVCGDGENRGTVVGATRSLLSSSLEEGEDGLRSQRNRGLQSTGWQVDFIVTEVFVCDVASCSSPADFAAIEAISEHISSTVMDSLDSEAFVTVLSENIAQRATLNQELILCLKAWGIVDEPVTVVADTLGTGVFYPDWENHSGTCLEDGKQPFYMERNAASWLFDSLEECCQQFYEGWNHNQCMKPKGSRLWYVSHLDGKCVRDCVEGDKTCGGLANLHSDDLYISPRECCKQDLPWVFVEFCEAESLMSSCYGGTGLFYRGDGAGKEVCVRDCDPDAFGDTTCGGIVKDTYVQLYETAEGCCLEQYIWIQNELCAARSTEMPLERYWPDMTKGVCVKDSVTPTEDLDVTVYDSALECCESSIHWRTEEDCLEASGYGTVQPADGSGMWFIDWLSETCVRDCISGSNCGGLVKPWEETYADASLCCDQLPYRLREDCTSS